MRAERLGALASLVLAHVAACGGEERQGPPANGADASAGGRNGAVGGGTGGAGGAGGRRSAGGAAIGPGGTPRGSGGGTGSAGARDAGNAPSAGGAAQSCNEDSECIGGEFCIGTSESVGCVPGDCTTDVECPEGTQCYRAQCTPLRIAATNCDWEARCLPELRCTLGVCTPPLPPLTRCDVDCDGDRACMTDEEGRPYCVESGLTCPNGVICSYLDYCGPPADGGFSCRPRLGKGEPCQDDRQCGIGLTCTPGGCARRGEGSTCVDDGDCPEDTYCFQVEGPRPATCVARIVPHAPCGPGTGSASRDVCVRGFHCSDAGRCEPQERTPCTEVCPAGERCEKKIENGKCSLRPH